jgi:hypothetical protein
VFSHYGTVYDVILFRAFQGAPTTRVGGWGGVPLKVFQLHVFQKANGTLQSP